MMPFRGPIPVPVDCSVAPSAVLIYPKPETGLPFESTDCVSLAFVDVGLLRNVRLNMFWKSALMLSETPSLIWNIRPKLMASEGRRICR